MFYGIECIRIKAVLQMFSAVFICDSRIPFKLVVSELWEKLIQVIICRLPQ